MLPLRAAASCILIALLVAGCATPKGSLNHGFTKNPGHGLPRRVLLVEPDIRVHEVSAGGVVEKVDEWSRQASGLAIESLRNAAQRRNLFELVPAASLTLTDKAALEQHAALYALVAGSAYGAQISSSPAWRQRAAEFDYTLGNGLASVAQHSHVDAAVFVVGSDYISTAGRKAAMVFGILTGALTGMVTAPGSAPAFMSLGVVDMRSGELVWYSTDFRDGAADLRDAVAMKSLIDEMMQTYPGAAQADEPSRKK
jgi:hypothetical protein